jgi:hypothetical protein
MKFLDLPVFLEPFQVSIAIHCSILDAFGPWLISFYEYLRKTILPSLINNEVVLLLLLLDIS